MFRCVCLFVLLPLCVLGQADELVSTPSTSFIYPTDQPTWEETHAPTEIATTPEPYAPDVATFQPALDRSDANENVSQQSIATTVAPTIPQTPQPTDSGPAPTSPQPTDSPAAPTSPQVTNSTTAPTSPQVTNSTAAPTSPQPTNSTAAPTSHQPTNSTAAPTSPQPTNSTAAPTTASTPVPTTPPLPEVGDYVVRAEWNTSACLMARMGLQFSFRMGNIFQTINLDPNVTKASGTCGNGGSDAALMLKSDNVTVQFIFTNQTSKFFLSALNLTVLTGSGPIFAAASSNLSLWEASLGSSYMCKKEQSFNITDALLLSTFELQVQPFGVMNDEFSTAHECSVDDASLLIPIIVGAALAVLILIVVIAYVIGRRKTYVGYQTL